LADDFVWVLDGKVLDKSRAELSRSEYLHGKTADATHGLGPDGVVWAKSTVNLFLNDLAHDNSVRALNDEYQVYFGALTPAAGIATTAQH
jgi:hypothetical protein